MNNPFKRMTKREWSLWFVSITIVVISNIMAGGVDALTLTATCIGVTSLIFAAQGNVWAPILMTIFCIQYAIISYRFRYWGEMFTYLFMSLPMSVWAIVTWLKNARNSSNGIVEIRKITRKGAGVLVLCNVAVTIAFYMLLKKLNTPNLIFSTISVVTSFFAASLTMLRSSYYALGYASNDIVLIILWILASIKDPRYIPVVVNFLIFFLMICMGSYVGRKEKQHSVKTIPVCRIENICRLAFD